VSMMFWGMMLSFRVDYTSIFMWQGPGSGSPRSGSKLPFHHLLLKW